MVCVGQDFLDNPPVLVKQVSNSALNLTPVNQTLPTVLYKLTLTMTGPKPLPVKSLLLAAQLDGVDPQLLGNA